MKLCLLFLVFVCCAISELQAQTHPVPPGFRRADIAQDQAEKSLPPLIQPKRRMEPEKLRRAAGELASLSQSIPSDVEHTVKFAYPKDLDNRLKRIEKLAKELRTALNQ